MRSDSRGRRQGLLGEAMEKAEVEVVETLAKECRQPADYYLFKLIGLEAIRHARNMSTAQRSEYVAMAAERLALAARECRAGNNRLQHAIDFNTGLDDEAGR